jgi:type VI secretion system protein ImpA
MTDWNVEDLQSPLSEAEPCGPDLEYDAAFVSLEYIARGTPERQSGGGEILLAEPPPWPEVHAQALALSRRTRDLRIAVLLTRSAAHQSGISGYAAGLALVAGLLERYWPSLYPRLDASDANDPTMRLNALAPLADAATGLQDLRTCLIGRPGSGLTVRLVELGWGKSDLLPGEVKPTQDGLLEGLRAAARDYGGLAADLVSLRSSLQSIERTLTQHVGAAGPDLRPLQRVVECCALAGERLQGSPASPPTQGEGRAAEQSAGSVSMGGSIETRADVLRALDQACRWIESHEPTNPAPLLIRRAQRLMSKSFMDLVRDLAPEGLPQIERIAGVGSDT